MSLGLCEYITNVVINYQDEEFWVFHLAKKNEPVKTKIPFKVVKSENRVNNDRNQSLSDSWKYTSLKIV